MDSPAESDRMPAGAERRNKSRKALLQRRNPPGNALGGSRSRARNHVRREMFALQEPGPENAGGMHTGTPLTPCGAHADTSWKGFRKE